MGLLRKVSSLFLSTKTALWLLLASLALLAAGAVQMPAMEAYSALNSMPLFEWLRQSPLSATWWLWGIIGVLSLLTLNAIICGADSLIRKRQGRQWLLVISPQAIHAGFLFILLAHLVSSAGARHWGAVAGEGTRFVLPNGTVMEVREIDISFSPSGFPHDWRADIAYYERDGRKLGDDFIAPNRPSFRRGIGLYIKDVRPGLVRLEASREPGAPWALAGGVLFTLGTGALLALKVRREK